MHPHLGNNNHLLKKQPTNLLYNLTHPPSHKNIHVSMAQKHVCFPYHEIGCFSGECPFKDNSNLHVKICQKNDHTKARKD